jgi:hypothetical protein
MVIWRSSDLTTALHFSVNADDFYFKCRPILGSSKFGTAAGLYTPAGKLQAHNRPCSAGGTSKLTKLQRVFHPYSKPMRPITCSPNPSVYISDLLRILFQNTKFICIKPHPMTDSCGRENEHSGSTKSDKFIDLRRDYWLCSVHFLNPRVLRAVNAHAAMSQ